MNSQELCDWLSESRLTQLDFARLIGASARSVSSWTAAGGSVPGSVEAYTRLFSMLPESTRQLEIQRLRGERFAMREGMFYVDYASVVGSGWAVLTLDRGAAYGFDAAGGQYDGIYLFNAESGVADVTLKVTIPPNVQPVFSPRAEGYERSFKLTTAIDPNADEGRVLIVNPIGSNLDVAYKFLRPLPERSSSGVPFVPVFARGWV